MLLLQKIFVAVDVTVVVVVIFVVVDGVAATVLPLFVLIYDIIALG